MARRRKSAFSKKAKTRTKTVFKRIGSKAKKGFKGMLNDLPVMSFGYGLVRNDIAGMVTPMSSKLPFGELNDEIALGLSAYLVSKLVKGSTPIMKKIIDNEAYTAGLFVRQGVKGTKNSNGNSYVYG